MAIDGPTFRRIMGGFATGVTIVTTRHEGRPAGMTANAVCSVSMEPLLVLFCADRRARTHDAIDASGVFAINVLTEEQRPASELFARSGASDEERFAAVRYRAGETGSPLLEGAAGWLDCRVKHRYPGGDHTIFVAEVVDGAAGEGVPLLYHRGKYARLER